MPLAGLYRSWQFGDESITSFSIITLPPQDAFVHIHKKSYPLMLQAEDFDRWLDPGCTKVDVFQELMQTGMRTEVTVTPVDSPSGMKATGESELIKLQT